jgi:oxygen-dependent protoporphyrinogen oxidase
MPQYHVGHRERVAAIERAVAAIPDLAVTGAAYHGVGIPDCISTASGVARDLAARIRS